MNSFMDNLKKDTNYTLTTNGAVTHKSTLNAVYDMFALGGAYRKRSDEDCILLFKNALEEDEVLALKCLFYLRDVRGGQGERRFFRVCYHWLANEHSDIARRNFELISEYGRWDDIIYSLIGTALEYDALALIKKQLALDIQCKTPSLLAKWLPSENASSKKTKEMALIVREYLHMTNRQYRKTLSTLRERIKVLERLMSANRWNEIQFDNIPSKAGLIYKNAFARRDIIAKKYEAFAKDKDTKVNADTLYPYEVAYKAVKNAQWVWSDDRNYIFEDLSSTDRAMINKYWDNLPDYFNGEASKIMCVVDTSMSMTGNYAAAPINVAISLGMYCAERLNGPFKDHFISFSSHPQLIKIEGIDFVDKIRRIYNQNLCENTNLLATFELLRKIALKSNLKDIPETIVVISDMQIDMGYYPYTKRKSIKTDMELERKRWEDSGLNMPKLVYWNVNAANSGNILDDGPNISYVSGMSPILFQQVLTGKTGWDLCLDKLLSDRYKAIK